MKSNFHSGCSLAAIYQTALINCVIRNRFETMRTRLHVFANSYSRCQTCLFTTQTMRQVSQMLGTRFFRWRHKWSPLLHPESPWTEEAEKPQVTQRWRTDPWPTMAPKTAPKAEAKPKAKADAKAKGKAKVGTIGSAWEPWEPLCSECLWMFVCVTCWHIFILSHCRSVATIGVIHKQRKHHDLQ